MTTTMMMKIEEAKKMVSALCDEDFTPTMYEEMRVDWKFAEKPATPSWATLKKYATEAGLVAVDKAYAWHSDGSLLASMCGIAEGTIFHYTAYRFE